MRLIALPQIGETEVTRVAAGVNMLSDIWARVYDDCRKVETYLIKTEKASNEFGTDPVRIFHGSITLNMIQLSSPTTS